MLDRGVMPIISVIVPAYNAEACICKCIESVLKQTLDNFELIIVNDGSTDDTLEICKKYLKDKRVHLIDKNNGGVSSARNAGIKEAQGEYITFVDVDDYVSADLCSTLVDNIEKNDVDLCICGFNLDINGKVKAQFLPSELVRNRSYNISELFNVFEEIYIGNYFNSPWAKCYKGKLISHEFNKEFSLGEDLLFNLNYLQNCQSIYISESAPYYYCILQANSLSNKFSFESFESLSGVYQQSRDTIKSIWGNNAWPMEAIEKKYISDFVTLIDRWIRLNSPNCKEITQLINAYGLEEKFSKYTIYDLSKKNDLERFLIVNNRMIILKMLSKGTEILKNILKGR